MRAHTDQVRALPDRSAGVTRSFLHFTPTHLTPWWRDHRRVVLVSKQAANWI